MEKPKFRPNFSMCIVGSSNSGKSSFVCALLENQNEVFELPFEKIYYSYLTYQKKFAELEKIKNLEFIDRFPRELLDSPSEQRILIIADDLMQQLADDPILIKCFTTARHLNQSFIFITQDFYHKGKSMRTASRNSNYLVLFAQSRDKSAVKTLSYQLEPSKPNYVYDAWQKEISKPYSYLIIDLLPDTPKELRVRTGVLPDEQCYAYLPE